MKRTILLLFLLTAAFAASAQNTSTSYIEKFKDNAIRIMHESGIPASIVLAVAMHESGCGNSTLAQQFNNQFGIKGYDAHLLVKRKKTVSTYYKKYASVMDSFQDFARIMTERKQFSHLTEKLSHYDYTGWAKGIQHSGYAASRKWASQVLGLIKKYRLNLYDENPADQQLLAAKTP